MPRTPLTAQDIADLKAVPIWEAAEWRSGDRLLGYRVTYGGRDMPDSEFRFPLLDRDRGRPEIAKDLAEMRAEALNEKGRIPF